MEKKMDTTENNENITAEQHQQYGYTEGHEIPIRHLH